MKEEQYHSLQEEAEAKTKKLKKVFNKVREVLGEIKQIEKAQSREREDLLDTIRELTASLKLKNLVLDYFVPRETATLLENTAKWDEEEDNYRLDHLELSGNAVRPRQRPASASGLRRPDTASEKSRKVRITHVITVQEGFMNKHPFHGLCLLVCRNMRRTKKHRVLRLKSTLSATNTWFIPQMKKG
jgi:kinesin family protein 3/17